MTKKILLVGLIISAIFLTCSCGGNNQLSDNETKGNDVSTTENADTSDSQKTNDTIEMIVNGETEYKIVRSSKCNSVMQNNALALRDKIEKITRVKFSITEDAINKDDNSGLKEILVGSTNRAESVSFIDSLPENGYGYAVIGNKIIIAGKEDNLTAIALYDFYNTIMLNSSKMSKNTFVLDANTSVVKECADSLDAEGLFGSKYTIEAIPVSSGLSSVYGIKTRKSCTDSQGTCFDGKYFYTSLKKTSGDVETDLIVKYDPATKKEVLVSDFLPLDHCNDLCYNEKENLIYAVNMVGKTISVIDPETLTLVKQFEADLPNTPYAIAYDKKSDTFITLCNGVRILDNKFNLLKVLSQKSEGNYIGQGVDTTENYVLIPFSANADKGTTGNIIDVYNKDSGYIKTIELNEKYEIETLINYDGQFWASFNYNGARIVEIKFCIVFQ